MAKELHSNSASGEPSAHRIAIMEMLATTSAPGGPRAYPAQASHRAPLLWHCLGQRAAARCRRRHAVYTAAVGGGGGGAAGGGGNGGGGFGGRDGSSGGDGSRSGPWLFGAAAWALAAEGWAVWQYRGMAARDAARRAELFPNASPSQGCGPTAQQPAAAATSAPPTVSIIVPVLNEEAGLEATLRYLQRRLHPAAAEIIVVDGGSADATLAVARRCGVQVVEAGRGRARQMNAGAAVATGGRLRLIESSVPALPFPLCRHGIALHHGAHPPPPISTPPLSPTRRHPRVCPCRHAAARVPGGEGVCRAGPTLRRAGWLPPRHWCVGWSCKGARWEPAGQGCKRHAHPMCLPHFKQQTPPLHLSTPAACTL